MGNHERRSHNIQPAKSEFELAREQKQAKETKKYETMDRLIELGEDEIRQTDDMELLADPNFVYIRAVFEDNPRQGLHEADETDSLVDWLNRGKMKRLERLKAKQVTPEQIKGELIQTFSKLETLARQATGISDPQWDIWQATHKATVSEPKLNQGNIAKKDNSQQLMIQLYNWRQATEQLIIDLTVWAQIQQLSRENFDSFENERIDQAVLVLVQKYRRPLDLAYAIRDKRFEISKFIRKQLSITEKEWKQHLGNTDLI